MSIEFNSLFPKLDMKVVPLVEHVKVKEILNIDAHNHLSTEEIEAEHKSELLMAMRKAEEGSSLQKSIRKTSWGD